MLEKERRLKSTSIFLMNVDWLEETIGRNPHDIYKGAGLRYPNRTPVQAKTSGTSKEANYVSTLYMQREYNILNVFLIGRAADPREGNLQYKYISVSKIKSSLPIFSLLPFLRLHV